MLILTRKPGESLYIGDNVKVVVVEVKGSQVRLGIEADKSLRIYREEIYLQILEENKNAAAGAQGAQTELDGLSEAWKGRRESLGGESRKGSHGLSLGKAPLAAKPQGAGLSGQGDKSADPTQTIKRESSSGKYSSPQVITRKKKKSDGEGEIE